jgi:eukaryotic-like serine/threonine-protein kinase
MSDDRHDGETSVSVPERARRTESGANLTIAMPLPVATGAGSGDRDRDQSMMLDSYQPQAMGTIGMSSPPSGVESMSNELLPHDGLSTARALRRASLSDREVIVPSSATVRSILEQVRRRSADRLEVETRVAAGGMGSIDIAVDRALDRRIAVKTLHPHLRSSESTVRMFLREARLTGLLDHPHIVPVYDLGERDGGQLFFAMKLVEGQTLAALVRALPRGVLDTATLYMLLDVVAKVCDALAFAHSRGVLHCDVKPANVMVGEFGQVFLMDWGIARLVTHTTNAPAPLIEDAAAPLPPHPTEPPPPSRYPRTAATDNSVIGTPCYMSPEQARGDRKRLDARSDVFLLGAMLYELLTHRPPYVSKDRGETLALAASGTFPSPRKIAGDAAVPLELERIVMRAMAKRPDDRYPTIAALKEDLVRFMRGGAEFPRSSFHPGDAIVREGEPGSAAYILVEGRCEIRKDTPNGTQTLQTIGPGTVFGEMAILTQGPRTATVVAIEPTTVLVVTSQVLEQEMAALKPWMATLLKSLATRFRDVDTQARNTHATSPTPTRLANQILMTLTTWGEEDGNGGRSLAWSTLVTDLEAQLGLPPVALLGVIARYGLLLDVEHDRLTAPDLEALRAHVRSERPR